MIFVVLAVAIVAVFVGVPLVTVIVNNAMPSLCIVDFIASHHCHCRPAAFAVTTATGVSNALRPLLPPMWHDFPLELPWLRQYFIQQITYF